MIHPAKLWFFMPVLVPLLSSCGECEDEKERNFGLVFFRDDVREDVYFEEVYGLGGDGRIYINSGDSLYRLPISLHSDSSTYILKNLQGKPDTLTIKYKRDFFFESTNCGNRVRFHSFSKGRSTTFGRVEVVGKERDPDYTISFPKDVYEVRVYL